MLEDEVGDVMQEKLDLQSEHEQAQESLAVAQHELERQVFNPAFDGMRDDWGWGYRSTVSQATPQTHYHSHALSVGAASGDPASRGAGTAGPARRL